MPDREDVEISRTMYALGDMNPIDIYDVLCHELSFNDMIEVYRLIKHKMTFLDDEPRYEFAAYVAPKDEEE